MEDDFTISFAVERSPDVVYAAINNARAWWSGEYEGVTNELGAEFTYRYKDLHYSKQKVAELVPGKKVVWHVLDAHLSFAKDPSEWTGSDIVFKISEQNGKTELTFTHVGLTPARACYEACSGGWDAFVNGNLQNFINTGKEQLNPYEK